VEPNNSEDETEDSPAEKQPMFGGQRDEGVVVGGSTN